MRRTRRRVRTRLAALAAGLAPAAAVAQGPVLAPGAVPVAAPQPRTHWNDALIGYPQYFAVPPLGASLAQHNGRMIARAAPHRVTLYRSDFYAGTAALTPAGAARLGRMAALLPSCGSPLLIEWTPDLPGLSEARQAAVRNALLAHNVPIDPNRVVVGPSPYPGGYGREGTIYFHTAVYRSQEAGNAFPLPPSDDATFGGGMGYR